MFKFTTISIILLITSVVNFFVTLISWQRKKNKSGFYFALGISALTLWTTASGLDYAAVPIPLKVFFAKLEYVGYNSSLVFFVLFTIYYAGYDKWLENKWVVALLWIVPISNISHFQVLLDRQY